MALALQESNKSDEALAEYKFLAKMQQEDPVPLARVAILLEKMNRKSEAATAYLQLAEMYQQQKQMNKAVEAWRKASALEPEQNGRARKTRRSIHRGGTQRSRCASSGWRWQSSRKKGGDTLHAQQCVERALILEPDNTQARFLLNELMGRSASLAAQAGASPVELARRSALSRLGGIGTG